MESLIPVLERPSAPAESRSPTPGRQPPRRGGRVRQTPSLPRRTAGRRARVRAAALLLGLIVTCALAAPALLPDGANDIHLADRFAPPSARHPAGTDDLGRDVLARLMLGGRTTLLVAGVSTLIALLLGFIAGGVAGYRGGIVDTVAMRAADVLLAIPLFLVVLVLSSVMRPTVLGLGCLIGLTQWIEVARVVRSVVMTAKRSVFVEAACATGLPSGRVLFHHLLPHVRGPMIAAGIFAMAYAVTLESAMSFLGFGVQPPAPSWGLMLQNAQSHLAVAPWLAIVPGGMIFAVVFCSYVIGESFRQD